jgi:AraC-like DNA-binding protein
METGLQKVDVSTRYIQEADFIAAFQDYRVHRPATIFNKHEGYEIILVLSGKCTYRVEDNYYPLRKGDCMFIAEGEYHTLDVPDKCNTTFVDFRPQRLFSHPGMIELFLKPFMRGLSGGSHRESGNPALFKQILAVIRKVLAAGSRTSDTVLEVMRMLRLFEEFRFKADAALAAGRKRLQPAFNLLYENYGEPLTVPELARACALSRSSFYTLFKRVMKKEPKTYLNDLRLEEAVRRLNATEDKISDIALSVGFFNLSFFNRFFLRKMGCAPGAFRKRKGPVISSARQIGGSPQRAKSQAPR